MFAGQAFSVPPGEHAGIPSRANTLHPLDLFQAVTTDETALKGDIVVVVATNGAFTFHGILLPLIVFMTEQCRNHNVLCFYGENNPKLRR